MSYISAIKIKDEVIVWERDPVNGRTSKRFHAPYYFYVKSKEGTHQTIYGDQVKRYDFGTAKEFQTAREDLISSGIQMFESDIPPEIKILSQHYYNVPAPKLNVTFFDIEVDFDKVNGFSSVSNPYAPINSVAFYHQWKDEYVVFAVPPDDKYTNDNIDTFFEEMNKIAPVPQNTIVVFCKNEKELLRLLIEEIKDSDVICGWNSDFFDVPYVGKRLESNKAWFRALSFDEALNPSFREVETLNGQTMETLDLSGRISADYMVLFKKYEQAQRPSYKLESIAEEILPELPKLHYEGSLADLYRNNFVHFVRYNLRDTEVLGGFEKRLGYVELANQMYHMSTGVYKHVTGTLKLAELATVNYCHHTLGGLIVNDIDSSGIESSIQGAYVLDPKKGMHEFVGSIDVNSLYPSAIRSINISPETLRGQFVEMGRAAEEIAANSSMAITFHPEEGEPETMRALEWRATLLQRKWAVSGYGTVFDQTKKGIIPRILEDWYNMRIEFQKKKKQAEKAGDIEMAEYYDRIQYTYKIKLNSFYGALTNRFFRFYDSRMGESTTGTGRMVLKHQCAKTNELLTGEYDPTGEAVIYGDSVAGDTIIETAAGPVQIDSLFTHCDYETQEKQYCNLKNISSLTYDIESKKTVFKPIKYIMRHLTKKQMYRVWITNSQYVDVTKDHGLIKYNNTSAFQRKISKFSEITPTELLETGGSLIYQQTLPRSHIKNISTDISQELLTLAGYIMGDGYVDGTVTGGVLLSIGSQDISTIETQLFYPLQQQGWISSWTLKPNGHDVQISSVKLRKLMRSWLYSNGSKSTPSWLFAATQDYIASYLKGWFSADGWTNKNNTIGLTNIHESNIRDIHRLLLILGISSTWCTETTQNSFNGKFSNTYSKRLTVKTPDRFVTLVGFLQDRKSLQVGPLSTRRKATITEDFELVRPTKIEKLPILEQYVYDIEVDDTHMFFGNNILLHNTDSTYFHTFATTQNESVVIADAVAKEINDGYTEFMKDTFLCNDGYPCIKAEREIVSDRGIFVDKKRYILHVCDLSGKPADKMKIMGLDTKKTTLPKEVSKKLNHFIERLLKGEDWDVLAADIVEYKDQILNTPDIMSIGLPKGVKGVEEYTKELAIVGVGATIPGHVAAAIHYNQCLKEFDDKLSEPIKSGMKIKVFYLTEKYGKFKSIAIPVDIEQVPSWFKEKFTVDREAHLERLVDNPLQNILNAIGKQVPSKQSLLTESLLDF